MKNNLQDLNDYLFEQLERINDDDLTDEELDKRLRVADEISKISSQIINNAKIELEAAKYVYDTGGLTERNRLPKMLEYAKKG